MPQLAHFAHRAGIHCSSSSIADVLRFDGQALSEAMVFGLGSGLGFISCDDPRHSPAQRFNGRALDLEGKFYALFGVELAWCGAWQPQAIEAALAAGRPLLAQTDLAYLPYYEPVHFPLHGIVITGWDGSAATVADTVSDELQTVSADALKASLAGEHCPFMQPYRFAPAPRIALKIDAERLTRAIGRAASDMLAPRVAGTGIAAMRALARARTLALVFRLGLERAFCVSVDREARHGRRRLPRPVRGFPRGGAPGAGLDRRARGGGAHARLGPRLDPNGRRIEARLRRK